MISEKLQALHRRINDAAARTGRDPKEVRLLAVSKTVGPEAVLEAARAGHRAFGENKVQEAVEKIEALRTHGLEWHFIGHLQKNKVKYIPGRFALVHSIDSLDLAERLARTCREQGVVTPVLIQVNVSGEDSKFGIPPGDLEPLLDRARALDGIDPVGLMTLPPFDPDPEKARPHFARLRELRDRLGGQPGLSLPHLSMGMSHDFEVAVEEGATWIRVGTLLFGPRPD
ncbi:MAG: YggS family pyridoxal phosphate-dependent enzyme [Nitrospinaceae bacterium]